ncbi:Cytochrome P450 [Penicillium canariense]|uniref:Cytochrome P450 n=1 Tax=Penicillium canariense TaxID=189055 RepID=A0A9W9IDB4_9EURO|nr:Cytochrome P450 [Penicillium canariense]KAJ5174237.1 Cytochrome P450 [Penicillium canariense]
MPLAFTSGSLYNERSFCNAILFLFGVLTLWLYRTWKKQSHVPGPFMASISNISRLIWARSGRAHETHIHLHEKYGSLVRLGPNSVSVGDPREISKMYGIRSNFGKSDYYKALQPMSKGKIIQGLFNTQDDQLHRSMKKPIAGIYSMSNLVSFEPYVDSTISFFLERLEDAQGEANGRIDLGTWLQWFAFDVMGEITFSKRLGFLDEAKDVDGIMRSIWKLFRYSCWVGQMPWLDKIWAKNSFVSRLLPAKNSPVVMFALERAQERIAEKLLQGSDSQEAASSSGYNSNDFMSRFLATRVKDPSIPEWFVTAWTTSNVLAGSDTTAIMLRAIIYFLITNSASLQKLERELGQARSQGQLSDIATWKESRNLRYLNACVKEAGRLHPAIGLTLERVVPRGGATICGQFFEEGTNIGMNPWVIHRNKEVFGADANHWNPDRWLDTDAERVTLMENCLLTFGSGSRTCIGKNISYLEIYKLIPTMFARYEIQLWDPTREWKIENSWLVVQSDFFIKLERRKPHL